MESLRDEILRAELKALPEDLQALDHLLGDSMLMAPISVRWERLLAEGGRQAGQGRPEIAMETYVRSMIVKHRCAWGYETLMREVSDSMHLRRFCGIGMTERVLDESTVRKLTRRLGAEVVKDHARGDSEGQAGEAVPTAVRDRSRSMGRKLRTLTRTIRKRTDRLRGRLHGTSSLTRALRSERRSA